MWDGSHRWNIMATIYENPTTTYLPRIPISARLQSLAQNIRARINQATTADPDKEYEEQIIRKKMEKQIQNARNQLLYMRNYR